MRFHAARSASSPSTREKADPVDAPLINAVKTPVAEFGGGATQFKPAPAEAQTGLDG